MGVEFFSEFGKENPSQEQNLFAENVDIQLKKPLAKQYCPANDLVKSIGYNSSIVIPTTTSFSSVNTIWLYPMLSATKFPFLFSVTASP